MLLVRRGLDKMKNIIFIAPPAAGKGTVSDFLVRNCNYEHISTGDLLREEIRRGSPLGEELDKIIKEGNLVSDEFMIKLMDEKIKALPKDKPFILDGFPRTIKQAESLDKMLVSNNVTNNMVVFLDIALEDALARVLGRIICPKCGRSYNINHEEVKPKVDNICDDCGIELEKRDDDTEESFKIRFDSYLTNTKPIIEYYEKKNMLKRVDATIPLSDIFQIIKNEANK